MSFLLLLSLSLSRLPMGLDGICQMAFCWSDHDGPARARLSADLSAHRIGSAEPVQTNLPRWCLAFGASRELPGPVLGFWGRVQCLTCATGPPSAAALAPVQLAPSSASMGISSPPFLPDAPKLPQLSFSISFFDTKHSSTFSLGVPCLVGSGLVPDADASDGIGLRLTGIATAISFSVFLLVGCSLGSPRAQPSSSHPNAHGAPGPTLLSSLDWTSDGSFLAASWCPPAPKRERTS